MVEQDGYQGNVEERCELSTEVVEKIEKVRNQDLGMK
jgi:2,4-dienoyl-CoA reductase-like NADH-dependent reductase (Old Yellow Enzyme family)